MEAQADALAGRMWAARHRRKRSGGREAAGTMRTEECVLWGITHRPISEAPGGCPSIDPSGLACFERSAINRCVSRDV